MSGVIGNKSMRQLHFTTAILFSLILLVQGPLVGGARQVGGDGVKAQRSGVPKLDSLFEKLKAARSEAQARSIEADIWQQWSISGVSEIDSLMKQAKLLALRGHYEPSLGLLARVIYEQPEYSEGWNRKATVLFYMMRDKESLVAIKKVLALEPRHFGALAGKAMIKIRAEQWGEALVSLRRAVEIHPWLKERHLIKILEQKLQLRDL